MPNQMGPTNQGSAALGSQVLAFISAGSGPHSLIHLHLGGFKYYLSIICKEDIAT